MRSMLRFPNVVALGLACTPQRVEPSVAPAASASPFVESVSTAPPAVSVPTSASVVARRPPLVARPVAVGRRAITNQPVVRPEPWPNEWCLSHASIWSPELESKYVGPGNSAHLYTRSVDHIACDWSYIADGWSVGLAVGVKTLTPNPFERDKARYLPALDAIAYEEDRNEVFRYVYWHKDPPYALFTYAKPPSAENKQKVASLTRDLIERLTEERLSYPTAQLAVLGVDRTGDLARRVLAEWEYLAPIFAHVAPLAPGYPRLAKGTEFTGDPGKTAEPEEQFLLLGVCLPPDGQNLALLANYLTAYAFGNAEFIAEERIVDAKSLTIECPSQLQGVDPYTPGDYEQRDDGTIFQHVYSLGPKDDPVLLRGAAILRSKDKQIIDSVLYEIPRPLPLNDVRGRYQQVASRRLRSRCGGYAEDTWVQATCDVEWSDMHCRHKPESTGGSILFRITEDQRIELKTTEVSYPGDDCVTRE